MNSAAAAAARLRSQTAALRSRPQAEIVDSLAALFDAWSDRDGHCQRELAPRLAASSGFSEATVRNGMGRALADWNGDAFRRVIYDELGASDAVGHELTSLLLAGCIPMPTLLQIAVTLAVRSPALVKMASRDRVSAHAVRASLETIDPQLARCIEVLEPETTNDPSAKAAFLASPCVVANGSDATLEVVRAQLSSAQTLIGYGHRLSIAVLGGNALDAGAARALGDDVAAWDQLGCLSPAMAFLVGGTDVERTAFAAQLAGRLEELEAEAPRGAIDSATAAAIRSERETARMRFANKQTTAAAVLASSGSEWTVVLEPDVGTGAELRPAPLHRFLRLYCVRDVAALATLAAPLGAWLSTIAVAGLSAADHAAVELLGGHRCCSPGEMQVPALGWHRDGLALLRPLLP